MNIERRIRVASKRRSASSRSQMVDLAWLFLPLVVSLVSLVIQYVMHTVFWEARSVRDSAFPLFLISVPFFLIIAGGSIRQSTTRGGEWVMGSVVSIVAGVGIMGCTTIYVFIGGFAMK